MKELQKIHKNSVLGIIAPANHTDINNYQNNLYNLRNIGFSLKFAKSCYKQYFNFAGEDIERAQDINELFSDDNVDALLCLRGGYGSIRLLNLLDYEVIRKNPKLLIGFSDITSLHIALNKFASLPTLHGPMLCSEVFEKSDEFSLNSFLNILQGKLNFIENPPEAELKIVVAGQCTGQIIGGNLELVKATLGTPYEINTKNRIIFLEEINEATYKIDRNLQQLKLAGKFDDCSGVILGNFKGCAKQQNDDLSIEEIFKYFFSNFKKPVISNLKSGHCCPMISLPFGVNTKLNALEETPSISLLENFT